MDTLTYKCMGCGASLEYDIKQGLFYCNSCGQYYKPDMPAQDEDKDYTNNVSGIESANEPKSIFDENEPYEEFMDVRVYHCSSCGSEIMTGDAEVSTFCSFCGQSTILFDKISKEKRPRKIIPFKITKEDALHRAQYRFNSGKYSFNNINEVTVESVKAIYMPYYVYDSEISVSTKIDVKDNHDRVRTFEGVNAKQLNVALDASERFNDKVSVLLNPYNMSQAEKFNMSFLSGFYADRSDIDERDREEDAKKYLLDDIKEDILDKTPGVPPRSMRDIFKDGLYDYRRMVDYKLVQSEYKCHNKTYMLLPVYFITFMAANKTVIILVNGQTGKVVGNVPIDDKKFGLATFKYTLIGMLIGGIAGALMFRGLPIWWAAGFIGIVAYSFRSRGIRDKSKFINYYSQTNSVEMFSLSNDREKKV